MIRCLRPARLNALFGWCLALAAFMAVGAGDAPAADIFWSKMLSDLWGDAPNWSGGAVPGTGDNAIIDNGERVDVLSDVSMGPGAITNLFVHGGSEVELHTDGFLGVAQRAVIGSTTGTTGTLILSGGDLDVGGDVSIGENGGTGVVNHMDGDLNFATDPTLNGSFSLGSTGIGTYNMDGGLLSQVGGDPDSPFSRNFIGRDTDGVGTLNLSAGTVSFNAVTVLGAVNGASGTVNQTGGLFEVRERALLLGDDGTGTQTGEYNISGGTLRTGTDLSVANGRNSVGLLNVSGTAAVEVGDWMRVGQGDASGLPSDGTVNQTGGSVDVAVTLGIGVQPGATGSYDISDGTLTTGESLFVGGPAGGRGTINLSDTGDVTANDQMAVGLGPGGTGVLNQTGGVLRVVNLAPDNPSVAWIGTELPGTDTGADGQYNLSGGSAIVDGFLIVGELANTTGEINVSDTADLTVGTVLLVGGDSDRDATSPGFRTPNTGTMNQTDGTVNVLGQLQIGLGATATGVYEQTGGDLTVEELVFIGLLAETFDGEVDSSFGAFNLSAGTAEFNGAATILGLNGVGEINQSGGDLTILGQFPIGTNVGSNGTYNLSDGDALIDDTVFLGNEGVGLIRQTGGDMEITSNLQLGTELNGDGTYEVSDGFALVLGTTFVGGSGVGAIQQSGGDVELAGNLQIGNDPTSTGSYEMSGGTLTVDGATFLAIDGEDLGGGNVQTSTGTFTMSDGDALFNEIIFIGFNGDATFTQTGGILQVSSPAGDDMVIGVEALSDAEFNISGGTAFMDGRIRVGEASAQNARLVVSGDGELSTFGEILVGSVLDNSVPANTVDNHGFVLQSGGTVDIGLDLILGLESFDGGAVQAQSHGVYSLSGGTLIVAGGTGVGLDGSGRFTQTGGEHQVFDLQIAIGATSSGTYQLQGGVLNMLGGQIQIGAGQPEATDFFEFTGGVLRDAGAVDFSLVNDGGAIEPGASAGLTLINGDYTVTNPDAAYNVEIGGTLAEFEYDVIDVLNTASLDGIIDVTLIDGFEPMLGDMFDVLLANQVVGTFATEVFPIFNGLTFQTNYFPTFVQLEVIEDMGMMCLNGDTAPCSGRVDIDDLNAVRNNFGAGDGSDLSGIPGDAFPFDGFVNIDDLNAVRNNFGAIAAPAAVPEPGTCGLLALALICGLLTRAGSRIRRMHGAVVAALVGLALLCGSDKVRAADVFWDGGVSDQWEEAGNWVGGALPGPGDNAIIGNGTTAVVVAAEGNEAHNVFVNGDSQLDVVADGLLQVDNRLAVGNLVATTGALSISGAIDVGAGIEVGENTSTGSVDQTGGDVLFATAPGVVAGLRVGNTGAGQYMMSGGALGQFGADPTNPFSWNYIGRGIGGHGILDLSDGAVTFASLTAVGATNGATGVVNQSGGMLEVGGGTSLVLAADGAGSDGQYNLSGGDLSVSFNTIVGSAGTGLFNQTGGAHTTTSILVGGDADAQGTYQLMDGTVDATLGTVDLAREGRALFDQTGGGVTTGAVNLGIEDGSRATYELAGGTLGVADIVTVGVGGRGTFHQSDGEHSNAGILIADADTSQGTYQLSGGILNVGGGDITVGAGAPAENDFLELTGGVLRNVGSIGFTVANDGATIQPGASAGTMAIDGDFTINSPIAVYDAEIGGLFAGSDYDQINVAGVAALDGILNVSLIDAFMPSLGDLFSVLVADSLNGVFAEVNTPALGGSLDWQVNYLATTVELEVIDIGAFRVCGAGDTSPRDGRIDIDDLNAVRDHFGATGSPGMAGDTFPFDGVVNIDDLNAVRNTFGSTASSAVPEPASLAIMSLSLLCVLLRNRGRRL